MVCSKDKLYLVVKTRYCELAAKLGNMNKQITLGMLVNLSYSAVNKSQHLNSNGIINTNGT